MWKDGSSTAKAFDAKREAETFRQALRAAGIDAPVQFDEVTASTNDTALLWAERGEPEWSVVVAGHQTGGRGRLGRTWESTPRGALLFSFVLRPAVEAERGLLVTLLAGVAMAQACRDVLGASVRCKWPNDLMANGGKVGGILTEARIRDGRIQHVVVGVGLNLDESPDVLGAAALGGGDRGAILTAFFKRFRERYVPGGDALAHGVVSAYAPFCETLGRDVKASTLDGRIVMGRAADIDPGGGLVIETEFGRQVVGFGEVQHLR